MALFHHNHNHVLFVFLSPLPHTFFLFYKKKTSTALVVDSRVHYRSLRRRDRWCLMSRRRALDLPRQLAGHQGYGGLHETGGRQLLTGHAIARRREHRQIVGRHRLRSGSDEGHVGGHARQTAGEPPGGRRVGVEVHHQFHSLLPSVSILDREVFLNTNCLFLKDRTTPC